MTRTEGIQQLLDIRSNGLKILNHLEASARTAKDTGELQVLATNVKDKLKAEYERSLPESAQRKMTLFELSVYSPTIEEAWKETGISRLKTDGEVTDRWREIFEAIHACHTRHATDTSGAKDGQGAASDGCTEERQHAAGGGETLDCADAP
jgi:hypothetical protein